jgi:hypothetical protein
VRQVIDCIRERGILSIEPCEPPGDV